MTTAHERQSRAVERSKELPETEGIFFREGYLKSYDILGDKPDIGGIKELCRILYNAMDGLISSFTGRVIKEGKAMDCKKGCSICCHQTVLVLPHEMMNLASHVSHDPSLMSTARGRAIERDRATSAMTAQDFIHYKHPCMFLSEDGACKVYMHRPLACRTYLSSSVRSCHAEYREPRNPEIYPSLFAFPLLAGHMLNEGITAALEDMGIANTQWLFEASFLTALEPGTTDRWIAGEDVFRKRMLDPREEVYLDEFNKNKPA